MRLSGHRSTWDQRDTATLYRCIAAGMLQEQIAQRLGRTKRAIRWKIGNDRASAAAVAGNPKGIPGPCQTPLAGCRRSSFTTPLSEQCKEES